MKDQPVFLFGSGISVGAGMPSTKEITEAVLSGSNISRHTDGRYYGSPSDSEMDYEYKTRALAFVKLLEQYILAYYTERENKEVTYEDLYYLAFQIAEDLHNETENPGIHLLLVDLALKSKPLLNPRPRDLGEWDLVRLSSEGKTYILNAIRIALLKEGASTSKFTPWIPPGYTSIFTLNHDLLIEQYFAREKQDYVDGFSPPVNGVRWWEVGALLKGHDLPHLIKLHGSVDWYYLQKEASDFLLTPAIAMDGDIDHATNLSGEMVHGSREPIILAGTMNKMAAYSSEIFAEMHSYFRQKLDETKHLVICGYGFGDKGINNEILRKAYGQRDARIVVIHPNMSKLLLHARNAVRSNWEELVKLKKFVPIESTFESATWAEITAKF